MLDDFLAYLEDLNKKGASMHPDYTQKDMRMFEREYKEEFLGRYEDPLAAFIDHHAVRLGYLLPSETGMSVPQNNMYMYFSGADYYSGEHV